MLLPRTFSTSFPRGHPSNCHAGSTVTRSSGSTAPGFTELFARGRVQAVDVIRLASLRAGLILPTLAYLALPLALFLVGFLKLRLGVPLTLGLAAACRAVWRNWHACPPNPILRASRISQRQSLAVLLLLLALLCTTGAGGAGPQTWDWAKHNAIFKDLIDQTWPVRCSIQGDPVNLVYYLHASLVGKHAGRKAANLVRMRAAEMLGHKQLIFWRSESAIKNLFELQKNLPTWNFVGQYVGTGENWFAKCCMADTVPRQVQPTGSTPR